MKRLILSLISVSALASGFAACSSASSNGAAPGADGGPTTSTDACASYASATVAYEQKCNVFPTDPSRASSYAARLTQVCNASLGAPGVSSSFGSALSACGAAITSADCSTAITQLPPCQTVPNGTFGDGAACAVNSQCSSGQCSASVPNADGGESECGTCVAAIADGASCISGGACVAGDLCAVVVNNGAESATCTRTASPQVAVGGTCTTNADCAAPNHCVNTPYQAPGGTCTAPSAAGATCVIDSDCAGGLTCSNNGATTNVCATPLAPGAACTVVQGCAPGYGCGITSHTCDAHTFAAPGASCDGFTALCSKGTCETDGSTGTCPVIIADGQPCTAGAQNAVCDDFASCISGTCQVAPATCN